MSIKITIPNTSSDVLTFGSANTPTAAQIAGIDSGSSNGQLALYTTASGTSTERVRVDASGNVGIGTASPTSKLSVSQTGIAVNIGDISSAPSSNVNVFVGPSTSALSGTNGDLVLCPRTSTTGSVLFYTGNGTSAERARIDSSGNLLVGTTSTNYAGSGMTLSTNSGTTKWLVGPTSGTASNFWIASSGTTGVYLNGTAATSWSSNSDENLKTDLKPIENAAEKVASLRAVTGRYKTDEEGYSRAFLIAQDVQAVLPEAVAPTTMYDGTEVLGLAYTETIPLLVAAIKEQQAIITSLTDRITALEGAK